MPFTRRGFLGLLASAGIFAAEARSLPQSKASPAKPAAKPVQRTTTLPSSDLLKGRLLIDSYLPILKVNEGEKLNFYHKPGDKVTVGYGTNVESNPSYLSDVTIYYRGKPLMPAGKKVFLATMAKKNQTDLAQYTITAEDAKKMAIRGMRDSIPKLAKVFATPKNPASFYGLPLCMQALCLDIFYNVGSANFEKFKKFKAAIQRQDFDTAVKESVVYVDKKKKTTNFKREWMKKRLLAVTRLVQKNSNLRADALERLVTQNYEQTTPLSVRILQRSNLKGELSMAIGELTQIRLQRREKERARTSQAKSKITLANGTLPRSVGGRNT